MIYKNNHSVIAAIEAAVLNCQLGIHPRYFWFNKGNNKNKTNKKTQVFFYTALQTAQVKWLVSFQPRRAIQSPVEPVQYETTFLQDPGAT